MKKTISLLATFVLLFTLASCTKPLPEVSSTVESTVTSSPVTTSGGTGVPYEESATQIGSNTTFYNEYIGIAFEVRSGWWQYERYEENFADTQGVTGNINDLYVYSNTDFMNYDYDDIYFGHFANMQFSNNKNHVSIELYALRVDGINTLNDFVDYIVDYNEAPYSDGRPGDELVGTTTATIDGRTFTACTFKVQQTSSYYYYITYMTEMNDGFYLVVRGDYWPDNAQGADEVLEFVQNGFNFI
jgi:hypothetical protein